MKTHTLSPLDIGWTQIESRDTPMHVAGLMPFSLPRNASRQVLQELVDELRSHRDCVPPWNYQLRGPGPTHLLPEWVEQDVVDLDYHVRHVALPRPGGERELGELVAQLHSEPIDMELPPWEFYVIEGLKGRRFAIYLKMHHALIDGINGANLLMHCMSENRKESMSLPPFWTRGPARAAPGHATPWLPTLEGALRSFVTTVEAQLRSVPDAIKALAELYGAAGSDPALQAPYDTPLSIMNGRVGSHRRVATQLFEMERLQAVARARKCTLNDVVVAICGGGLRRFLLEEHELPGKSLTAGIPVSTREMGDEEIGTQVAFLIGRLGTDEEDPLKRLAIVRASTQAAKLHFRRLPREAITDYTMLLLGPSIVANLTPVGGHIRPLYNVTVSNVPGPARPLYFRGAKLEAVYPLSMIGHGLGLNITCQSYAGVLAFAFVGCADSVPHLQRLALFTADALEALERAARSPARRRTAARTGRSQTSVSRRKQTSTGAAPRAGTH